MTITEDGRTFDELSSGVYTATLKDENDAAIALDDIVSVKLSLIDVATDTVINSRDRQSVATGTDDNDVTIHATSGLLTWEIQPEDNVIVTTSVGEEGLEEHHAIFEVVYNTSKRKNHRVKLYVRQIGHLTS